MMEKAARHGQVLCSAEVEALGRGRHVGVGIRGQMAGHMLRISLSALRTLAPSVRIVADCAE